MTTERVRNHILHLRRKETFCLDTNPPASPNERWAI